MIRDDVFAVPSTTLEELTGRAGPPVSDYIEAHLDAFAPVPVA